MTGKVSFQAANAKSCPFHNVTQHEQTFRWNAYSGILGWSSPVAKATGWPTCLSQAPVSTR